jgi:hypothetical protein
VNEHDAAHSVFFYRALSELAMAGR